jgi:hypothetical protein
MSPDRCLTHPLLLYRHAHGAVGEVKMINLVFALVAEAIVPLPSKVVSERRGGVLRVQMPGRAITVAAALAIACGSLVLYVLPVVVHLVVRLIAWASASAAPHLTIPRAAWAGLATIAGCWIALRFLGLYARGLAHVASPNSAPDTIRYTLAEPRRPRWP